LREEKTMAEIQKKAALVVSAHSGDFVWRAGGAIALYASRGWKVKIVCLSFGERGESAKLWKEGGMTLARVKALRRDEALAAAAVLGGEVEFFDCGDYPMNFTAANLDRLVDIYRSLHPEFILTHSLEDPYNFDHPLTSRVAQEARIVAQAHGHKPGETVLSAPLSFCSSPIRPSSPTGSPWCFSTSRRYGTGSGSLRNDGSPGIPLEYYTRVALNRGLQAARNSSKKEITYAEAYERVFPEVTDALE